MCINTKYSMSIIEKVFHYEATELSVIKCKDEIWFRGKTIAEILGYAIQCKAILDHVDHSGNLRQGSRIHCLEKCCFLKDVDNSAYYPEIWPTN